MPKKEDLMITTQALTKTYQVGDTKITVLKDINLNIENAKFIAICGPSGSGKTTLLNIISGIDRPTSGRIIVGKEDLTNQTEDFLSDFRCNKIGFVFQAYNLVSTLTVAENVAFPMEWVRKPEREIEERVNMLLETVGLTPRANHFPSQLSGGEQQRVALARALSNDPALILADEPTGNLDQKNGEKIIQILKTLKTNGKTVIVSTHDPEIRRLADQAYCFDDGRLAESE
jgi:putative ABC transport system ATP-binding protein